MKVPSVRRQEESNDHAGALRHGYPHESIITLHKNIHVWASLLIILILGTLNGAQNQYF